MFILQSVIIGLAGELRRLSTVNTVRATAIRLFLGKLIYFLHLLQNKIILKGYIF